MKSSLTTYSEEAPMDAEGIVLRKFSRGERNEDDEEVFTRNELSFPKPDKPRRHSTIKRTKSQWENFVESVDVNSSIHSGVFKLTLHQVKSLTFGKF